MLAIFLCNHKPGNTSNKKIMSQTSYDPTNKERETNTYDVLQPAHIRMHNMEAWFWTLTMFKLIPSKNANAEE
jgi:hypothetical protein